LLLLFYGSPNKAFTNAQKLRYDIAVDP